MFLSGASGDFAGKGNFLRTHGFELKDLGYWESLGDTERSAWGLSDRLLLAHAKTEIEDLEKAGQPFALSMLTLDNHDPVTEFSYCPNRGIDGVLNAMACQGDMVGDFIDFMQEKGYLDNTAVIVMADHKMLDSYDVTAYRNKLDTTAKKQLPIFARFYSPLSIDFKRDTATQLSIFPTAIELMGGKMQDGRAGLGVSLTRSLEDEAGQKTVLPLDWDSLARLIQAPSALLYNQLWDSPGAEPQSSDK